MALRRDAGHRVDDCWSPTRSEAGVVTEEVVVPLHSWTTVYASAAAGSRDPAAGIDNAGPLVQEWSECEDWLAALEGTQCAEKAPGWCHGPSYEIRDHDEDLEDRAHDMIQPCHLDLSPTHELGAHWALEGLNMSSLCSELASAHYGLKPPLAVPHGWCADVDSVSFPLDRVVGHRLREDRLVRKDSAVKSD